MNGLLPTRVPHLVFVDQAAAGVVWTAGPPSGVPQQQQRMSAMRGRAASTGPNCGEAFAAGAATTVRWALRSAQSIPAPLVRERTPMLETTGG